MLHPSPPRSGSVLALCALLTGSTGCAPSEEPGPAASSTPPLDVAAVRAAVASDMASLGATAMSLAVVEGGEVVWSEGFGTTRREGGDPVTADTRFRVASITRPMTSVALLQAVEDGCLDLDDPVDAHVRFSIGVQPEHSADLAVRHTLANSGGLLDYELQTGQEGDGHIEDFLREFQQAGGFLAPPGRMYNYSNTNFVVAGRLVEVCADAPFRAILEDDVWGPLGMDRTALDQATVLADEDYAEGLTTLLEQSDGALLDVGPSTYSAAHLWPAMGAWSSANDLAALAAFLLRGDDDVLEAPLLEEMTGAQIAREEGVEGAGYGYGLKIREDIDLAGARYPVRMISHDGFLFGYSAHLYAIPELDLAVIALLNVDSAFPEASIEEALRLDARVSAGPITEPQIDPDTFADLVGVYRHPYVLGDFIFSLEDGTLQVSVPSLDAEGVAYTAALVPVAPDNFDMVVDGRTQRLSFLRDDDGAVEFVRNRYYVGERTPGTAAARVLASVPTGWWSGDPNRPPAHDPTRLDAARP